MKRCVVLAVAGLAASLSGEELRNGTYYPIKSAPAELIARSPAGKPVRFLLEENASTGYRWEIDSNTNECTVAIEHLAPNDNLCGSSGKMAVTVLSKVQTPVRVEFRYRRPWEKDAPPRRTVRLVLHTADRN